MRRKGIHLLALEVPGLAEKRPSLVHGDKVYAELVSESAFEEITCEVCPLSWILYILSHRLWCIIFFTIGLYMFTLQFLDALFIIFFTLYYQRVDRLAYQSFLVLN